MDSLPRLGENFTFQILEEIYREYNALNSLEHRGSVLGKMLSLAYLFDRKEWIKTLYNDFLSHRSDRDIQAKSYDGAFTASC